MNKQEQINFVNEFFNVKGLDISNVWYYEDGSDPEGDEHGYHYRCVHSEGGEEGGGEYVERVMMLSKTGITPIYFCVLGHYESYNGIEYDDSFMIVEPREVTVTQYFEIKE